LNTLTRKNSAMIFFMMGVLSSKDRKTENEIAEKPEE